MREKLELILRTLDRITVKGKDNLDMLLGVILTVEQLIKETEEDAKDA